MLSITYIKSFNQHLKAFLATKFFIYAQDAFFKFFINIYFWRITEDIAFLVLYNSILFATHALTYIPAGKISKEFNRFLPLRIGIVLHLIFFFLIIYLQDNIVNYIIPVALIGGMGHGFYWSSDNLLKFDLTNPKNRLRFTASMKILHNIAKSVFPLLASLLIISNGTVIDSYLKIFVAATAFALLSLASTFFISKEKKLLADKYQPFKVAKALLRDKNIRLACWSTFMLEASGVLTILLGLMLFFATGSELSIGSYQFITVAAAIGAYYFLGNHFSKKDYKHLLIFGGVANFLIVFILFISQSYFAIIIYGILKSLFSVANAPRYPITLDALNMHCKTKEECINQRVEYMTLEELFGGAGKVAGLLVLLILSYSLDFVLIATVATILAFGRLIANLLASRIKNHKYVRIDELN